MRNEKSGFGFGAIADEMAAKLAAEKSAEKLCTDKEDDCTPDCVQKEDASVSDASSDYTLIDSNEELCNHKEIMGQTISLGEELLRSSQSILLEENGEDVPIAEAIAFAGVLAAVYQSKQMESMANMDMMASAIEGLAG